MSGTLSMYLQCTYSVPGRNTGICPQCVLLSSTTRLSSSDMAAMDLLSRLFPYMLGRWRSGFIVGQEVSAAWELMYSLQEYYIAHNKLLFGT